MLSHTIKNEKSATGTRIRKFGLALAASRPLISRANQLYFLCGANRKTEGPSVRRELVKRFIEGLSSEHRVIYAERVFSELLQIGNNRNLLDLEHEISAIADKIIIILESPSAYCELGAFAHPNLRKKLIIVNDSHYKGGGSFINIGPIAAATEAKSPVLWYPMSDFGIDKADGIGAIFNNLKNAIDARSNMRSIRISTEVSDLAPNKICLYFVHDLVLFTGPVSYDELISVMKSAFGDKSFDMLKRLLGVLRAADLISSIKVGETWVYRPVSVEPFLKYGPNDSIYSLMASFRRFHLRNNPGRFASEAAI